MPPRAIPASIRVWRRIEQRGPDECWPWTGSVNAGTKSRGGPYGHIGEGGRTLLVHRVVYESEVGPIPAGHQIDHTCDFSLCCNPRHLKAATPWHNNARSSSATSLNIRKDACPQGHEYTPENTGYRKVQNYRYCRTCARLAQRAKRERGLSYPEWLAEFRAAG